MNITQLYEEFILLDELEEQKKLPFKKNSPTHHIWLTWNRIHQSKFLSWIWQMKNGGNIQDTIRVVGTLHMSLRFLQVLKQNDLVEIDHNGNWNWLQPLEKREQAMIDPVLIQDQIQAFINKREFGQFRCTWESSLNRAQMMRDSLSPWQSDIFFCGDDDFTSLATAEQGRKITVGDVDEQVLQTIQQIAETFHFPIESIPFDVRNETPAELRNRFHAFHCDPLDNGSGLDAWLTRAFELLTGQIGDQIFLNVSMNRLGPRMSDLQQFLLSNGFALTHIHHSLSQYPVIDEPYLQVDPLTDRLGELDVDKAELDKLFIYTDLLIFKRVQDRQRLWPQDYIDFRRQL
ncbi:hypothetical protein J2Z48_000217 [Croceifilum oryzae]|uniref:N(4)-bis(aminopropyl)spermidine synthase C-terminal domain-containing protein n=1 Tax=Croceifilum oryzae TaxID=1553429 RepID=A0AAJ1TH75_9BACL|nr:bis-aminopropyl spermidine synthase family protein [Croceifilum oryzae]MDQ0416059.1 hypothetical protein [Croceifilum oryzae]